MKKQLLQQALDALENGKRVRYFEGGTKYQPDLEDAAIIALRSALAAPQPEPVHQFRALGCSDWYDGHPDRTIKGPYETRTLYASPPAAPAPAVREPLTDEQIEACIHRVDEKFGLFAFARAIEQAHGITGGA